jgi:hypothetical protein
MHKISGTISVSLETDNVIAKPILKFESRFNSDDLFLKNESK